MDVEVNNRTHLVDFIRLNEMWITEHFALEDADRNLAANPAKVIDDGGYVLSIASAGRVVGVCALFVESPERFQLARMAVEPSQRGLGYGRALMERALEIARSSDATSVFLLTNTLLTSAIALYRRFGFLPVSTGQHPVYARCNMIMERALP